ncbi:hypothetical protein [Chitinophaga defluvii]|uniref:DUF3945 domain-containing protein n=1 Tax=Chitinophaga defluvii TaxID=3163343 RepID=A0ABV2T7R9_9BACT
MKISTGDYETFFKHLTAERWQGNEFVAFPDNEIIIGKEYLAFFPSLYEAQEYCYENTTDVDRYDLLSVQSACYAMSDAARDKNLMIENGGVVDIAAMVRERYKRMEDTQFQNEQKQNVMNIKNFEYLRDQVKYTGFGEALEGELKKAIEQGQPEFRLKHQANYGNDQVFAELHFSKSKQSDMYFFNSYNVALQKGNNTDAMEHTFYINKGNNITLKEAYNLMEGRSVNKDLINKDGQVYNAWLQMDFKETEKNGNFKVKQFHQNYGYDLEAALAKHPIKELGHDEYKNNLLDSLKKGNLQSATFQKDGTEQKHYVEANPRFKTVNVYDSNMQRMDNRQAKTERQSEGEKQAASTSQKAARQAGHEDDGPDIPQAKKKRRKQSQSA